jgi:lipopolysaccharide transport system ATP-binding protein
MSDSDTVISVESLSKRYLVGHEGPQERYHSLRDTVVRHGKNFLRKTLDMAKGEQIIQGDAIEEFWALKDINLEVRRGEVLGIIGRNGAGKSTLLKILSRITEPTSGRVTLRGRVATLLEVGTGFHPELTGRENIFLNGAILGMNRAEIISKFDEIIAFAEVERFLDTPVKRYSSGMYVRLAFAVAAHLNPDILIVDEVLAVGDAQFQKKCLGKLEDVANGGRTVIFVSHNMPVISNFCHRVILLDRGTVKSTGEPTAAIAQYQMKGGSAGSRYIVSDQAVACKAAPYFRITDFFLTLPSGGLVTGPIDAKSNTQLVINIVGECLEVDSRFNLGFALVNEKGDCVMMSYSTDQPEESWPIFEKNSINHLCTRIDTSVLNEGDYSVHLLASLHCVRMLYCTQDDITIDFMIFGNRGNSPYWTNKRDSILAPVITWYNSHLIEA